LTELSGLAGDGRPFSLFFPDDVSTAIGLEYGGPSLLGAGVNCDAALASNFAVGASVEGVELFFPKKPKMLFCPLSDCEPGFDFFSVVFGVLISLSPVLGVIVPLSALPLRGTNAGELLDLRE
jgi:hypothetical protein